MKWFTLFSILFVCHSALADTVAWNNRRGTLQKADFNDQIATYRITSSGGVGTTFRLSHVATTAGKFTYSKWEIDRWGDPAGSLSQPGSWQAVTNAANDVGLALWGYWGSSSTALANGDTTTYQLSITFDQPVTSLVLPLHGINALLDTQGNNAIDSVSVASYLDDALQASPAYSSIGSGVVRTGDTLKGNFSSPIGTDTGRINTSDQGSATLTFPGTIDKLVLTISNEARHPTPAQLQNSPQNWSLSLGDLTFEPAPVTGRSLFTWLGKRGTLVKSGFDTVSASYQALSDDGAASVTFDLAHVSTTENKFSYSKWEIERWGDPTGLQAPTGSWQVTSNAANDVALGLWGYWGTDGAAGSPPLVLGDKTSYQLTMTFDRPVTDLKFPLHGINAILSGGLNSVDSIKVDSFLGTVRQADPTFSSQGQGMTRTGNVLTGNFNFQIGGGFPNITDDGSVSLRFGTAVDKVVITLVNEANHPTPASFQAGPQNWSFAVGDMSFVPGVKSQIEWASRQGQLTKPGFVNTSANYQTSSSDGGVTASFQLDHLGTTGNKFSYSKWEINRWGDPNGVFTAPGSWQMVSNSLNDVVFGIWGYWGTENIGSTTAVAIGDQTSYRLTINFSRTVEDLGFFLNGLNALIKPESGFNSQDILTVESYLGTVAQGNPAYSQAGNAFTRSGDTFTGDYAVQINNGFSGQHISDQGSVKVKFSQPVDRVVLTLVNRAGHLTPSQFQGGQQTFSYSLGGLDFRYASQSSSRSARIALLIGEQATTAEAEPVSVACGKDGSMLIRVMDPMLAIPDLSRLEISTDLQKWDVFDLSQANLRAIEGGCEVELPRDTRPDSCFFRWRK